MLAFSFLPSIIITGSNTAVRLQYRPAPQMKCQKEDTMETDIISNTGNLKNNIDHLLIRLIATSRSPVSRTDLARMTGLSKMTISKHITDLIQQGLIAEQDSRPDFSHDLGRNPIPLVLSDTSPCLCGTLIKRSYMQTILTDISGKIIDMTKYYFHQNVTAESITGLLLSQYDELSSRTRRRILGCGISSIGPINNRTGCILNPANFYGIKNLPVASILSDHTGLPVYLIHDANAGALVEKLYGKGISYDNFMYLHIEDGIGLGFVLNGALFHGLSGQSGEIGHTSINFSGPRCSCGNIGCLELYASTEQMCEKIYELLPLFPQSAFRSLKHPSWTDILNLASKGDSIAITALDEFCGYLAHALANSLKLLDFSTIIVGYDSSASSDIIERLLQIKLKEYFPAAENEIKILHSRFNNDAPLIGAAAVVANEVFHQNILL